MVQLQVHQYESCMSINYICRKCRHASSHTVRGFICMLKPCSKQDSTTVMSFDATLFRSIMGASVQYSRPLQPSIITIRANASMLYTNLADLFWFQSACLKQKGLRIFRSTSSTALAIMHHPRIPTI